MEIKLSQEEIQLEIKKWINENREYLPLNIDSWKIGIFPKPDHIRSKINFGKYSGELGSSTPFYKPISKLFKL